MVDSVCIHILKFVYICTYIQEDFYEKSLSIFQNAVDFNASQEQEIVVEGEGDGDGDKETQVCIYAYIYIKMNMYVHTRVRYIYTHICIRICMYRQGQVCIYANIYEFICTCKRLVVYREVS